MSGYILSSDTVGFESLVDTVMSVYNSIYDFFTSGGFWDFFTNELFELKYYSFVENEVVTESVSLIGLMLSAGVVIFASIVIFKWIKNIIF